MVYQQILSISTQGHGAMSDLTKHVERVVTHSGVKSGIAHIFNVGALQPWEP